MKLNIILWLPEGWRMSIDLKMTPTSKTVAIQSARQSEPNILIVSNLAPVEFGYDNQ